MDAFEGFRVITPVYFFGPVVTLLLLIQVFLAASTTRRLDDEAVAGRYRKTSSLAMVTVLLALGASVVCVLFDEINFARAAHLVTNPPDGEVRVVLLFGALAEISTIRAWIGAAVALAGLAGIGCVTCVWLRYRKRGEPSAAGLWVVVGVGVAAVGVGGAWAIRQWSMSAALWELTYAGSGEERTLFSSLALEELPSMTWGLGLAVVALVAAAGAVVFRANAGPAGRTGGVRLLPIGLVVLLLGGAAFLATRGHARDVDDRLPALVGEPFADFTDTQCRYGDSFWPDTEIHLPDLLGGEPLVQAPVLNVGQNVVSLGGKALAHTLDVAEDGQDELGEMAEILGRLKAQYREFYEKAEFPGKVILRVDTRVPGAAVARVLAGCAAAGYDHPTLAFSKTFRFESHVFGTLKRNEHVGLPLALTGDDEPEALRLDETLGQWAARTKIAARAGDETVVLVRVPD